MTLDELKKKYGGRSDAVGDTCCRAKPEVLDENATCLCTVTEIKEGKAYIYCRKHGDKEKLAERDRILQESIDKRKAAGNPSYPLLLPARTQAARPDSHLGGVEGGVNSTEVDWYGEGYEYGI